MLLHFFISLRFHGEMSQDVHPSWQQRVVGRIQAIIHPANDLASKVSFIYVVGLA